MITWGIGLMVVGGLSFVLPLFGRQFILVSALGLTGIGPFLGGIVLFGIGVALFVNARRPETTDLEVRLAKRAPPSRSVAESNVARTSAVNPSGTMVC